MDNVNSFQGHGDVSLILLMKSWIIRFSRKRYFLLIQPFSNSAYLVFGLLRFGLLGYGLMLTTIRGNFVLEALDLNRFDSDDQRHSFRWFYINLQVVGFSVCDLKQKKPRPRSVTIEIGVQIIIRPKESWNISRIKGSRIKSSGGHWDNHFRYKMKIFQLCELQKSS